MKNTYRILNLKSPSDGDQPATKQYADINFFFRNGSHPMTGNVKMNNHQVRVINQQQSLTPIQIFSVLMEQTK